MPYRDHNLMHLLHLDPDRVKLLLLETYQQQGSLEAAAKELGISPRTLWLYTHQLDIRDEFRAIKRLLRRSNRLVQRLQIRDALDRGFRLPDPKKR